MEKLLEELVKMSRDNPNDHDLGKKLRAFLNNLSEQINN